MRLLSNLGIAQKGLVLVTVPLGLGLILAVTLLYLTNQAELKSQTETRQQIVKQACDRLERAERGAVRDMTAFSFVSHAELLRSYELQRTESQEACRTLQRFADAPGERVAVQKLLVSERQLFDQLDALKGERLSDQEKLAVQAKTQKTWRTQFNTITELRDLAADQMVGANQRDYYLWIKRSIVGGALVIATITVSLSLLFFSNITARLGVMIDNSRRLANRQPLHPSSSGSDELANLDHLFHDMAKTIDLAAKRERAIVDNALDIICSLNKNSEFTAVSPSVETTWKYSQSELIGRPLTEFLTESDAEQTTRELAKARALKECKFENRVVTRDGTTLYFSWSAHWSAEEQTFFCVAHDVTDRKRAEELLRESESKIRLIIESMPVGLLIADANGYIQMTNIQTDHTFVYRYEDLLGEHVSKLFGDGLGSTSEELWETARKYLGRHGEVNALKKDGSIVQLQVSLTEFNLHGAKKILAAMLDVSERHAVEQLKKQLIATVSHDLRTPLTMIQNCLFLLQSQKFGKLDERGADLVQSAETEAIRLIELINSLLDIEKMESGKLQMDVHSVSVDSVISRSVTVVSHAAEQQDVEVEAPQSGHEVHADGAKLVQVMVNLLSNAIKFSPPQSKVTVRCEEEEGWLQIRVSDHGRGISPNQSDLVFEKFYQVEDTDRSEKGGTGLGLAICKTIVEAHGGSIGVDSEVGRGSTFWFKIPANE